MLVRSSPIIPAPHKGSCVDTIKHHCWQSSPSSGMITCGVPQPMVLPPVPQLVIDNGLIPPLVEVLRSGDFKTKKEAAWAVSNLTVGGSPVQVSTLLKVDHALFLPHPFRFPT